MLFPVSKRKGICRYGMSIIGTSHVKRGGVCQDAHGFCELADGRTIAAVADGVGSAAHSDIASKMAVDTVLEVCIARIDADVKPSGVKSIIIEAYEAAEKRIADLAESRGDPITEYDTTLTMAVYDGEHIVYGHSGDGGIVGLTVDGRYVKITSPQKADDFVCVIPLRAGRDYWVIDECEEKLASVLLATDGVYDTFFPYLLKGQPVEAYVPLIRYFMDNNWLEASASGMPEIQKSRAEYLCGDAYESVTDDKTVAVLINADVKPSYQPESYYAEPDWDGLQLEWNKKAYPHLYAQSDKPDAEPRGEERAAQAAQDDGAGGEKAEP